jgi:hypothetical protein
MSRILPCSVAGRCIGTNYRRNNLLGCVGAHRASPPYSSILKRSIRQVTTSKIVSRRGAQPCIGIKLRGQKERDTVFSLKSRKENALSLTQFTAKARQWPALPEAKADVFSLKAAVGLIFAGAGIVLVQVRGVDSSKWAWQLSAIFRLPINIKKW